MDDQIRLQILTPGGAVYDQRVSYVHLPLEGGSIGVMAHHAPLLGALEAGTVRCTCAGTTDYIAVGPGVARVADNTVTLLTEQAEPALNGEDARARAARLGG